jgi:hypothetical protein
MVLCLKGGKLKIITYYFNRLIILYYLCALKE